MSEPTVDTLVAAFERAIAKQITRVEAGRHRGFVHTATSLIDLAEGAIRKVDQWGVHGMTRLSLAEIDAMACVIAASGAIATLRERTAAVNDPTSETHTEGARS